MHLEASVLKFDDNAPIYSGVPLDASFNIFKEWGNGLSPEDSAIAFKYLEKLDDP